MTKNEVVKEMCRIMSLVYHSIGDYSEPSDGFCDSCPNSNDPECYKHTGKTIDYIREAVVRRLGEEGYTIARGFDPLTGKEIV